MDGALIERARKGDADAFDELARQRIDSVYRTALGILGSPADARGATQEALLSAWRSLASLRDVDRFDVWLYRITLNAARMMARKRLGVRDLRLTDEVDASGRTPAGGEAAGFDRAFETLTGRPARTASRPPPRWLGAARDRRAHGNPRGNRQVPAVRRAASPRPCVARD